MSTEAKTETRERGSFETVRAVLVAALIALFIRSFVVELSRSPQAP